MNRYLEAVVALCLVGFNSSLSAVSAQKSAQVEEQVKGNSSIWLGSGWYGANWFSSEDDYDRWNKENDRKNNHRDNDDKHRKDDKHQKNEKKGDKNHKSKY
ncbi:MAG: hypothetical protein HYX48_01605 [Chlamydiales bacterium]|nr:hypothetical protein [Chlamydiales bacterium]